MTDLIAPSHHEKRWVGGGLIVASGIIAYGTFEATDHVGAFVATLGAVGQVGIACAVYMINRLQWRLQAETARQDRAREDAAAAEAKQRESKRLQLLREDVRENVDAFYRAFDPDARSDAFERLVEPLLDLKRDTTSEQRSAIADFVKFTRRVRDNTVAGRDGANDAVIGKWREQANSLLTLIGASMLDWRPAGSDRRR